jgi:hypothetical protein
MKTNKYSGNKHGSDADVDRFCQSVEQVLTDIKDKRNQNKRKKKRAEDILNLARQISARRAR